MKLDKQYISALITAMARSQVAAAMANELDPTVENIHDTGVMMAAVGVSFAAQKKLKTKEEILQEVSDLLDESGKLLVQYTNVTPTDNPIHIAYAVAKLLVDKGHRAGVLIGADDVAVAIKMGDERMLQIKISQNLADKGTDWIVERIVKQLSNIN